MVYYDSYDPDSNDKSICTNYYGLGSKEKKFIWPISKFARNQQQQRAKSGNHASAIPKIGLYNSVVNFLGGDEIIRSFAVSPELVNWIEDFQPELIYCHISSLNQIIFVKKIQSIFKIPVAIHIMDDWFNVRYKKGLFAPYLRYRFFQEFKRLLSVSSVRMGIGQKMCDLYQKNFDYSFLPFSNPIEIDNWSSFRSSSKDSKSFKIVYAGTINSKNVMGLKILGEVVEELNSQGKKIRFEIFTFQPRLDYYRPKYENPPSVTMCESPGADDEMARIQGTADLLFLPVDFTEKSIARMRYSIFAKIPAYMASGTPILFFGPSSIASVEYAIKERWAYVVDKNDRDELKRGLIEIMSNSELRDKLTDNAQRIARRDFDAVKVRESFRKALFQAAIDRHN